MQCSGNVYLFKASSLFKSALAFPTMLIVLHKINTNYIKIQCTTYFQSKSVGAILPILPSASTHSEAESNNIQCKMYSILTRYWFILTAGDDSIRDESTWDVG